MTLPRGPSVVQPFIASTTFCAVVELAVELLDGVEDGVHACPRPAADMKSG